MGPEPESSGKPIMDYKTPVNLFHFNGAGAGKLRKTMPWIKDN